MKISAGHDILFATPDVRLGGDQTAAWVAACKNRLTSNSGNSVYYPVASPPINGHM
jgi:hypothetical protein